MDEFIWLRHAETGGSFRCPADAAEAWQARGWEPCDPPEEPDPATAEQPKAPASTASTKAARRGTTQEG